MTAIVTDIKAVLPRNYFWDVDSSKLDAQVNKMFIVSRVFMNITPAEVSTILPVLLKYYSSKDIYETLSQSEEFLRLNMKAVNAFCVEYNYPELYTKESITKYRNKDSSTLFFETWEEREERRGKE